MISGRIKKLKRCGISLRHFRYFFYTQKACKLSMFSINLCGWWSGLIFWLTVSCVFAMTQEAQEHHLCIVCNWTINKLFASDPLNFAFSYESVHSHNLKSFLKRCRIIPLKTPDWRDEWAISEDKKIQPADSSTKASTFLHCTYINSDTQLSS